MPTNIPFDDDFLAVTGGKAVILGSNLSDSTVEHPVLGTIGFDEIHAAITPLGIFIGFELDSEEIEAVKRGNTKFMVQFIEPSGISPFMILFEREIPDVELRTIKQIRELENQETDNPNNP